MIKIAIFASGNGSNAQNIIEYARKNATLWEVALIVTDSPTAGVIERARLLGVEVEVRTRKEIATSENFVEMLTRHGIQGIVLAGYLGLVPAHLVERFPRKILNIHPALLPRYGGKGMYGDRVHQAVIQAGETLSGITIHIVDEEYDKGEIVCQATCPVLPHDTPELLAQRIHRLEYHYYPIAIDDFFLREEK